MLCGRRRCRHVRVLRKSHPLQAPCGVVRRVGLHGNAEHTVLTHHLEVRRSHAGEWEVEHAVALGCLWKPVSAARHCDLVGLLRSLRQRDRQDAILRGRLCQRRISIARHADAVSRVVLLCAKLRRAADRQHPVLDGKLEVGGRHTGKCEGKRVLVVGLVELAGGGACDGPIQLERVEREKHVERAHAGEDVDGEAAKRH
mmetsp:Transcript_12854/g.27267  ORF Transcript_12854/g.27267 Transcript_12854/m.27267 type:complete len:200 (+) Transcript_12854:354-953(+)